MSDDLTHLDERGRARMVGVGHKPVEVRTAVAEGLVRMAPETAGRVAEGTVPKGDVGAVARVAGIMAAKRTPELIPLCHPLPLNRVEVDVEVAPEAGEVRVRAEVETSARTGVEMEALTAVSVAALAVYDMVKGLDRAASVEHVRLIEKHKAPVAESFESP